LDVRRDRTWTDKPLVYCSHRIHSLLPVQRWKRESFDPHVYALINAAHIAWLLLSKPTPRLGTRTIKAPVVSADFLLAPCSALNALRFEVDSVLPSPRASYTCAWQADVPFVIGQNCINDLCLFTRRPEAHCRDKTSLVRVSFVDVSMNVAHVPHGSSACRTLTAMHERQASV
jgi:hypothetical protein